MEYPRVERHRPQEYDVRAEGPRTPQYMKEPQRPAYDSANTPRSSAGNPLRTSVDGRDLTRSSLDIKDIVRASFLRERSRTSVERESVQRSSCEPKERESPRFGSLKLKDPARSSVDGRGDVRAETQRSSSSPRLSVRLKEAVRAAVEGRGEHVRSSSDSSDILVSSVLRSRDTPRSSSESRLLVELRESPRLARDAPRYSCDGRDVRLSVDSSNKDSIRAAAQRARDSPRLSVDGRGSPRLARPEFAVHGQTKEPHIVNSSHLQSLSSEIDGRDQSAADQRRRVPSLVARLMGLEDLPDEQPSSVCSTTPPKKHSKESKILKGLLQYAPLSESKPMNEPIPVDLQNVDFYRSRPSRSFSENAAAHPSAGSQTDWKFPQEPLGQLKSSPKQLGMEVMPSTFNKESRETGALRQKVVQTIPKQLTEAVLTVLKHSDDSRRMPMSYADMENRLRQLRLRTSLQEHKTLRQILEAMQLKGLLSAPRSKDLTEEMRESRQQLDSRQQTTPRPIMLPKSQEYCSESTKVRNIQELRKLGSKLQDQVFGSNASEGSKVSRSQSQPVSKVVTVEQESPLEASIVVMKPIGKPAKKKRAQNPALLLESMPGTRSPQGGRETSGKSSPWGSPVNRSARTQPGYGFGREPTNRFNAEDSASFKRRERIIARSSREVHSDPSTPRSPKLIALPQPTGKLRSSGSKEASEKPLSRSVPSAGSRVGEAGRRPRSTVTKEREETPKLLAGTLRSQSSRDLLSVRKSAVEPDVQTKVLRRSNSDGKIQFPVEKERLSGSPPEATVLRSRSSTGKSRGSSSDTEAPGTPTKKKLVLTGSKSSGCGDRTKDKSSTSATQGSTTPRSLSRNMAAEFAKKEEEEISAVDVRMQVRVTDGDATDQTGVRAPLVGLTNRLQNSEVVEFEQKDNQGLRTPRGSIIVKKVLSNQEDGKLVADIIDPAVDQAQPSPISVLDSAPFQEEDFSPLQLSKSLDANDGLCNGRQSVGSQIAPQADTALQESVNDAGSPVAVSPVENSLNQLLLKDSSKIVLPRGEDKIIGFQDNEDRTYVRDVLLVSGATMGIKAVNPTGNPIDSTVYDYLEEKKGIAEFGWEKKIDDIRDSMKRGEKARQAMDRRMLFDTVNDILTTMLVPYVNVKPWMQGLVIPPLRKRPTGQRLVQAVWDELQSLPPREPCDDICDSLYIILQKDLTLPLNAWTNFSEEVEEVGLEVERMIFKELVDEMVCCLSHFLVGKGPSEF